MNESEEEEAYKDLIAGSSSDEYGDESNEDEPERSKSHIEEMRQKLLGGLTGDLEHRRKKDIQASDSEELEV